MLKFYYSTQTCSTAARIALEEAGIAYEGIEVSWQRNVNVPELNAVNPMGQVPVLVAGDEVLTQSIAILEYIADRAPAKKLLPFAGTRERLQALSWLAFVGADFQKCFGPVFLASRWTKDEAAATEIRRWSAEQIKKHLAIINDALPDDEEFLLGEHFSVADAYLFTILGWCKWSKVPVSPYARILPYMKRVYARPVVKRVLEQEGLLDFFPE